MTGRTPASPKSLSRPSNHVVESVHSCFFSQKIFRNLTILQTSSFILLVPKQLIRHDQKSRDCTVVPF